jgi:hypothetical protein
MKIKKYAMMLACGGAILMSALSFQNSLSYGGNGNADVSLTLDDFFTVAFADGEGGSETTCGGTTCDEANGLKYNTGGIGDKVSCCSLSWSTSGKKKS